MKAICAIVALILALARVGVSLAQQNNSSSSEIQKPARTESGKLQQDPEAAFKAMLTDAVLSGRWASLKSGELGEEKSGDKYHIVSVTKTGDDNWTVNAKLKYRDQELVLPIPVRVKFAGDVAVMIVDKLAVPNGGIYAARLLFYDGTYSGTWSGQSGGGMLYGVITTRSGG